MSLIYLASPYTHNDKAIEQQRFEQVCAYAARLMLEGFHVYSPIAHGHAIAMNGGQPLPTDWGFWREHCIRSLSVCASVLVLQLDGWSESTGVTFEVGMAAELGIPVEYVAPFQMPINLPTQQEGG